MLPVWQLNANLRLHFTNYVKHEQVNYNISAQMSLLVLL